MKNRLFLFTTILLLTVFFSCNSSLQTDTISAPNRLVGDSELEAYVHAPDPAYNFELKNTIEGKGYTTYVLRLQSQRWLTPTEVTDPLWWHWVTIVVPDQVSSDIGLLVISGGSRKSSMPDEAPELLVAPALATGTVVAQLHNVPNQPMEFAGDDFGPRKEDELIAYGWRRYLEGGAKKENAKWLARLPMTKSAVRAMDAITAFCANELNKEVNKFTVMGGSKRGWTTWTTAITDDRVIAIAPVVIDMLNVVPSFQHHWQAYGFWAPAVGDYVREGVMEWQGTKEYNRLIRQVEPYSFRKQLTLPKFLINATGDQFFLPDSWQFYWNDLEGEKHLRYVPNAEHSLRGTDAIESFVAFYQGIVSGTPRPDFDWQVQDGIISIQTSSEHTPHKILLWQATNPRARDFRLDETGKIWTSKEIPINPSGEYELSVEAPPKGWTAFLAELQFKGVTDVPYKFTTGVVVTPSSLPFPEFQGNPNPGN